MLQRTRLQGSAFWGQRIFQIPLLLVGVLLLIGCGQRRNFSLFFTSNLEGNYEIYRVDGDGENLERLTNTPNSDEQFVLVSPDGGSIIFDRGGVRLEREIFILDINQRSIVQLTDSPAYDIPGAWSPDSTQIAFISDRQGGFYYLFQMGADGSNQKHVQLETDSDRSVSAVGWSPDGQFIAFGTNGHLFATTPVSHKVFILNLTTQDLVGLDPLGVKGCVNPSWSPDSLWIVATCYQEVSLDAGSEIFIFHRDGSESIQISSMEELGSCKSPSWSPSGDRIAMVCTRGISAGDYGQVFIISADGSMITQITQVVVSFDSNEPSGLIQFRIASPRWSPDENEIVYLLRLEGITSIYAINIDGNENREIISFESKINSLSIWP